MKKIKKEELDALQKLNTEFNQLKTQLGDLASFRTSSLSWKRFRLLREALVKG